MTVLEALKYLGIETPLFLSGVSGAIVFLTKNTNMTRGEKFLQLLAGGLSANYITPLCLALFNLDEAGGYGVGFLVGYSGMKIVELFIKILHSKIK